MLQARACMHMHPCGWAALLPPRACEAARRGSVGLVLRAPCTGTQWIAHATHACCCAMQRHAALTPKVQACQYPPAPHHQAPTAGLGQRLRQQRPAAATLLPACCCRLPPAGGVLLRRLLPWRHAAAGQAVQRVAGAPTAGRCWPPAHLLLHLPRPQSLLQPHPLLVVRLCPPHLLGARPAAAAASARRQPLQQQKPKLLKQPHQMLLNCLCCPAEPPARL